MSENCRIIQQQHWHFNNNATLAARRKSCAQRVGGANIEGVNQVSNGCSLNCASSPRVKARGVIEARPSQCRTFQQLKHFVSQAFQRTECVWLSPLNAESFVCFQKNVRFVKSLELDNSLFVLWPTTAFSVKYVVADPGFSRGQGANSKRSYYLAIFSPKIAWNLKNLDPQGAWRPP